MGTINELLSIAGPCARETFNQLARNMGRSSTPKRFSPSAKPPDMHDGDAETSSDTSRFLVYFPLSRKRSR